ncbi:calcium-binding and coiled-coil domain-containing protein 2 isoform X2 [Perognathus longimembris pacificus]|uniref:calcium-binding and coiled-coil domain-containing protein 2 isoform X2 n=1 Tax=Perognathus longimembris pacificus TaxID=214514 RepID=UPI002019A50B|nr:calcium-binding and coiled-coil domain-containing protein 2 isoform X2 [Perognathus longimembris pacificus]
MERAVEEPPSSAVLLDHCHFSQVIFNSVEKFYVPGGDITCFYTFTQHFIPRRKDWIGIFRVGWKTTREYYTFMWVALPNDLKKDLAKQQEVQFKAYYLPKDDEYYQFCYVDQDGVVRGASIPFQFRPESEEDILVVTTKGKVEEIEQHNVELCKENQELKDSCATLQKENSDMQAELKRKQEELETLQSTNNKLEEKVKEQKASWETELLQLKENNQKVSSENEKMGIRVDQLQKEHQKKLQQTVEELKQKETTAVKKQQKLTDENFELSRELNESKILFDILQREKERVEKENNLLKEENRRLLSYMGLDFDSLSIQMPTSAQGSTERNPTLVYGNPYSGVQESSASSVLSKKCLTCKSDFADEICDQSLEQKQTQSHSLNCPICSKVFSAKERQIFEDHVYCHSL